MADGVVSGSAEFDPTKIRQVFEHKHCRPLLCVRFAPRGDAIYFSAENTPTQRLVPGLEGSPPVAAPLAGGHDSWVRSLAVLPDGRTVVTAGYDGRLAWFDTACETPTLIRSIDAHDGWVRAVSASPDGRWLASCGNDRLVKIWDSADGREVGRLAGHESHVYEVAWKPDAAAVISCDLKGVVKEWDPTAGGLRRDLASAKSLWLYDEGFRADIGGARSICIRDDGVELALGGITKVTNAFAGIGKPVIVIIDCLGGGEPRQLEEREAGDGVCWGVAWHPSGFWIGLAGGGGGGWLRFFKPDATEDFHALKLPANTRGMALAPDAARVAVAFADGMLRVYAVPG